MPLADYAHWNEEAERVWWEEEGRHAESNREELYYSDGYYDEGAAEQADAYCEQLAELTDEELLAQLNDEGYCERWPQTVRYMRLEASERGLLG